MVFTAGFRRASYPSPNNYNSTPSHSKNFDNTPHRHHAATERPQQQTPETGVNYSKHVWGFISSRQTPHRTSSAPREPRFYDDYYNYYPTVHPTTAKLDLVPIGYNNNRSPDVGGPSQPTSRGTSPHRYRERVDGKPPRARMTDKSPREFWGYLISHDHPTQPTPLFRRLLGAIADYVIENMAPKEVRYLTPTKLAAFYREVGGDLDELFLGTPVTKLSDIYSTLGCAHSLQPVPGDDFLPPSIPALSTRGFAIWQTIQLLLDPEEHVHYLQNVVKKFPLRDPETGEPFPREIPAEAFPRSPDVETERWHDAAFERKNAEKKREEAEKLSTTASAGAQVLESEEDDWGYRPRRKNRHHYTTYEEPERFSRSAPGSAHEGRTTHRHSSKRGHKHHHSYSHPAPPEVYPTGLVVETPVTSDYDEDELYPGRQTYSSRHHSRNHSQSGTRHGHSSRSRSRHASREYLGDYVYSNGDTVPIEPYALPIEPAATYIRPPETYLHAYHSNPNLQYQNSSPQLPDDDPRSRFLRHRSCSPVTRAPLGGSSGSSRVHRGAYVEDEYEVPPPSMDPYYADVIAAQEVELAEAERRRKKEARSVEKEHDRRRRRERELKDHTYVQPHRSDTWGTGYERGGVYYA